MLTYAEDADADEEFDFTIGRMELYKNEAKREVAMVLYEENDGSGMKALMVLNLDQIQKIHERLAQAILEFMPTEVRH